ncbi:MAG: aspartyl-tRNA(Asn)/glutamyl-tRNA(Gln) amidotransferase subunit A [Myxococcota bacterium]|jgi:aspartyl-tRNA(Asn)/glutamyl-tRNA(Gln) amidotransferase subunit A
MALTTAECLEQIAARDAEVGAFLRVDHHARGGPGPMADWPVALKDNLVTHGVETTAGSKILAGWVPPYDATVVARLKQAGAALVGKVNLDEFAMGSSTEHSAFQKTANPHDLTRIPGGSSGGSAAAVAAGMCRIALGSDTGGSIRQPAALCGVVGLKPTWGRVSRYGLIAFASSLDQIGPLGHNVADVATALGVIAGPDPYDATCSETPVEDFGVDLDKGVTGLRIGICPEWFGDGLDPAVEARVRTAIAALEAAGAEIVTVSLPAPRHCLAAYYVIAPAEASSNLARFDGVRFGLRADRPDLLDTYRATRGQGFGAEAKRRIVLGTWVLSSGYYDAWYGRAGRVRTLIRQGFDAAFAQCDVIAGPTSPITAPRLGDKLADPTAMYLMDVYTIAANLAGIPAISVPCGKGDDGLPVGLQLMGRSFDERMVLRVAAAHERLQGGAGNG